MAWVRTLKGCAALSAAYGAGAGSCYWYSNRHVEVDIGFDGKKGKPVMDVTFVNGEKTWSGTLLCDTGADSTALTPAVVSALGLEPVGSRRVRCALGSERRDVVECSVMRTGHGELFPLRPSVRTNSKPLLGRDALEAMKARIHCRPLRGGRKRKKRSKPADVVGAQAQAGASAEQPADEAPEPQPAASQVRA
eukprot:TRINITY_DN18778_c0_g1_i1.p1 TRINITY_DN18778_c0_g1~~TRINITY_DN18778_c0_g1_i1.p1  ORF type:complete len:207 (+),score=63.45 TRINITY_DN18778_c0_g1_i1:43-621(+)